MLWEAGRPVAPQGATLIGAVVAISVLGYTYLARSLPAYVCSKVGSRRPTHLPFPERLQYIGSDQNQLLSRIPSASDISQGQLEDRAGYPPNELYWRLEQLYLMGLVMKRETDGGESIPAMSIDSPQHTLVIWRIGEQDS
jgi:hypothetical protein